MANLNHFHTLRVFEQVSRRYIYMQVYATVFFSLIAMYRVSYLNDIIIYDFITLVLTLCKSWESYVLAPYIS